MTVLGALVTDITFRTTVEGNLIPVLHLTPDVPYKCANLYALQKAGVWIGDTVWISPKDQTVEVNRTLRPQDASPAQLPTVCPSCNTELDFFVERRLVVKCPNPVCNARSRT